MDKKNIAIILGTRPEAIKLLPVYKALQQTKELIPILISTGQHKEMLNNIFTLFDVTPDIELNVMQPNQSLTELTARLFSSIGQKLAANHYHTVLVQGDTTTALVGGIVGHYQKSHLQNYIFSVNLPSSEGKKKCGLPFSAIIEASKQPLSPRYEFYRTRPDCTTLEFAAN
ncbi:MAG: UDP-N-acetylglucosamine 2-epimerase [Candidatus Thiothrix putei]|uniref:UDP-N-acetylglucosamine 2-epimerase (non-hydrolyzing) n=1 Tax=Candidatus Thiothrix putei TaxID=3080811 RepID=A0AA95HI43_9GAMM|nr:MAG: UDP-N-acetylglucosamine 2-epimerase [Candidatus Thiothrix putei]